MNKENKTLARSSALANEEMRGGKGQPLPGHSAHDPCTSRLVGRRVLVLFRHFMGRQFHCQVGTRYPVLFRSPCAEIGELATLRAKGAPRIAFPGGRSVAERTFHTPHHTASGGLERFSLGGFGEWSLLEADDGGGSGRLRRGREIRPRIHRARSIGRRPIRL